MLNTAASQQTSTLGVIVHYTWRSWSAKEDSEAASSFVAELGQVLTDSVEGFTGIEEVAPPVLVNVTLSCPSEGKSFLLGSRPTSQRDCKCSQGYYKPLESSPTSSCVKCPVGKYKKDIGDSDCMPCPQSMLDNSMSTLTLTTNGMGSSSKQMCICPAGYFGNWSGCVACDKGYYCPKGASEKSSCAPGTFSEKSQSAKCGNCPKGRFAQEARMSECPRCDVGRYQTSLGSSACAHCASGLVTEFKGSEAVQECSCNDGMYLSCAPNVCNSSIQVVLDEARISDFVKLLHEIGYQT